MTSTSAASRRRRHHIVVNIEGEQAPAGAGAGDEVQRVMLDRDGPASVHHNVWLRLAELGLDALDGAIDLFRVTCAVYYADLRVPRTSAFDRWSRDLAITVPVLDVGAWEEQRDRLCRLLAFLTGDHWEVAFYATQTRAPDLDVDATPIIERVSVSSVSLLSGGLDSMIGASDTLADGGAPIFVSHYAQGSGPTARAQRDVIDALRQGYPSSTALHVPIHLTPRKPEDSEVAEESTRSRSLVFFSLGILIASALPPASRRLVVAENGFISLNVPLAHPRLGSLSTKTTHPHTLALLREIVMGVGIGVELSAPYRFMTKGEMARCARDAAFVRRTAPTTVSCARPTQSRWRGGSEHDHCGYCFPCIVRRASLARDRTGYIVDIRDIANATEGQQQDVRALRVAIERARHRPAFADVVGTGPLHVANAQELRDLDGVYRRGLVEIARFLSRRRRQ